MTRPWGGLATYRKKKRQTFDVHLTKGVSVNPKAYCCDDPEAVTAAKPPVAILTATPNPIQEGDTCTLDLNNSYDPNGGALAQYEIWDGIGGYYNNPAGNDEAVVYPAAGRYEAMGVVTDATGLKGQASVWVDVLAGPDPPVPDLTGKRVIAATLSNGVIRTDDIYAAPTVWAQINSGLSGNALKCNALIRDPWDPSNTAIIATMDGIYKCTNVRATTPVWVQKVSNADIGAVLGAAPINWDVATLKGSICEEGLQFAIVRSFNDALSHQPTYILRTLDCWETWTAEALVELLFSFGVANRTTLKEGSLYLSSHDANYLWVTGHRFSPGQRWVVRSVDKGVTVATILANAGAELLPSLSVPYHNNPTDQRGYVWQWTALGDENRTTDGFANLVAINPPTNVRWRGMLAEHTWNSDLVRCVGEIGAGDSNGELTVSSDNCASWSAGVDIGMPVWSMSGFPYDQQLMYFGRAKNPVLGNYPADGAAPLIKTTSDGGGTLVDRSGNLRADFNVKCIIAIVPDWLEDE